MSALVRFLCDQRPHYGRTSVHINPDDVSVVCRNPSDSSDNPTVVYMKNGQVFHVEGYPDDVSLALFPLPSPEAKSNPATDFTSLRDQGPTEACLAVIGEFGKKEGLSNRAIRDILTKNGFQYPGRNFAATISKTLRRLHKSGRLEGHLVRGDWTYKSLRSLTASPEAKSNQ